MGDTSMCMPAAARQAIYTCKEEFDKQTKEHEEAEAARKLQLDAIKAKAQKARKAASEKAAAEAAEKAKAEKAKAEAAAAAAAASTPAPAAANATDAAPAVGTDQQAADAATAMSPAPVANTATTASSNQAAAGAASGGDSAAATSFLDLQGSNGTTQEPAAVKEAVAEPAASTSASAMCASGLKAEGVCCPKTCVKCGGTKCKSAPGGETKCCVAKIKSLAKKCAKSTDTACVLSSAAIAASKPMPMKKAEITIGVDATDSAKLGSMLL